MNNLRKLRKEKNLTLVELAEKTRISKSALSFLENEKRTFTQEHLEILTTFFGVSTDYLLGKTEFRNLQCLTIVSDDGSIAKAQHELIDATKGFTIEDLKEVNDFIDYLKARKEKRKNEK